MSNLALSGDVSKSEGNSGSTLYTYTVNKTGDLDVATTVQYAAAGSGANPANAADFSGGVFPSGTVSFAAGETSKTFTAAVAGDTTVEPNESFAVTLSNAFDAGLIDVGVVNSTITNDDTSGGGTVPAGRIAMISTLSGDRDADAGVPDSYWDRIQAGSQDPDQHPSLGTVTHTAIKSGNWNDPTLWDTGTIPAGGHLPDVGNWAVIYNHQMSTGSYADSDALAAAYKSACAVLQGSPTNSAALATIAGIEALALVGVHVGGTGSLKWATTRTFMLVETVFAHGTVEAGTESAPIPDSGIPGMPQARITFVGTKDPTTTTLLGFNTMSRVRIFGEPKTERAEMSIDPTINATSVTLTAAPLNWHVGDVIVITSTQLAGSAGSDSDYTGPTSAYVPYHSGADKVYDYSSNYYRQFGGGVFKQSRDEQRTITAINGAVVTFAGQPLAYDHQTYSVTSASGEVLTINSYCCNLSRSVRFEGLYPFEKGVPGTGRHRPHIMFMYHDDIKVHYAESKRTGRSRNDVTLWSEQNTDTRGCRASSTGAFLADINNVRGRYGWHAHWGGAFLAMKMIEWIGLSAWSPADEGSTPTWAFTHHNSRMTIERCIAFNFRGGGFVTELGSEIGQWLDCIAIWGRGDGFMPDWGSRQEIIANHNASSGVGFQGQARQVMYRGCVAVSCNIGFDWLQQSTSTIPGVNRGDMDMRSPEDTALRMFDPITNALSDTQGKPNYMPEMIDRYGNKQTQIPDFYDCKAIDVRWGFMVANRDNMDNEDVMPMVSRRFVVYASEHAYNIIQYSFNYFFYDYFFKGPGTGSGKIAKFFGTKTFNFNFVDGVVRDWTYIIQDQSFNYFGFLVNTIHNCPNIFSPIEQTITFTSDPPNNHPLFNVMGLWEQTSTSPNKYIVRKYSVLNYPADFPQSGLPMAPGSSPIADPEPGGPSPKFFIGVKNGSLTPTGFGTIHFNGVLKDGFGIRAWPDYQRFLDSNVVTGDYWNGRDRTNANCNGLQVVARNGCYNDAGTWKSRLWFIDADRATGEHIVFGIDFPLVGFDPAYLAANEVADADADATKPQLPLLPEARRTDDAPTVRSSPNTFTFAAQSEVAKNSDITSNTVTVARLTYGVTVAVSIVGGLYSKNGGAFTSADGTAKRGDTFAVQVHTGAAGGGQYIATLTIGDKSADFEAITENVPVTGAIFTDFFDRSADENLSASRQLATHVGHCLTGVHHRFRSDAQCRNGFRSDRGGALCHRFREPQPVRRVQPEQQFGLHQLLCLRELHRCEQLDRPAGRYERRACPSASAARSRRCKAGPHRTRRRRAATGCSTTRRRVPTRSIRTAS